MKQCYLLWQTFTATLLAHWAKKIHILGSPDYLRQELVQNKIRAVLLAGIRSAVLWKQMGGTKWQILFFRRKITLPPAKQIYSSIY